MPNTEKNQAKTKKHLFHHSLIDGFLHLLFPSSCVICNGELLKEETTCCSVCFSELSYTHYEKTTEPTALDHLFWGRVSVFSTYSMLFYEKHGTIKHILYVLKYKNRPDVGIEFGKLIANKLKSDEKFSSVEALIPVPLHRKKKYIRGYNQSEQLAKGIACESDIPVSTDLVKRNKHTGSQTRLGRFKRWDNVEFLFTAKESIRQYKHIALVDDVITTGATLEAIIRSIRAISPDIQISVISLAVTK